MAVKITYDTTSTPKLIRINDGITEIDVQVDLYSDSKEDWIADSELVKFDFPIGTVGGESLSATQSITPKFFLASGWRIKPFEGDHELTITGDLFSNSSPPTSLVTSTSGNFTVSVLFDRGVESITTVVSTSGAGGGGASSALTSSAGGGTQFVWDLGAGEIPLFFDFQFNGARVSGTLPTVEVYRNSDDFVLDWNSGNFVASPSGSEHLGGLSELVSNSGVYRRNFDPQDYAQTADTQIYYMQYVGIVPVGFNDITSEVIIKRTEIHKFSVPSGVASAGDTVMRGNFLQ